MSDGGAYGTMLRVGLTLRHCGRFDDSAKVFAEAIAAEPKRPEAYAQLALLLGSGPSKKKEALRLIECAISLEPDSGEHLGYKAYLLAYGGKPKVARRCAESALRLNPVCYVALLSQTVAFIRLNESARAETSSRRMLESYPEDSTALNLLAYALRAQRRRKESRAIIKTLMARIPNDAYTRINAGTQALMDGDPRHALQHYLAALRLEPRNPAAHRGLIECYRRHIWLYRVHFQILEFLPLDGTRSRLLNVLLVVLLCATWGLILFAAVPLVGLALVLPRLADFFLLLQSESRRVFTPSERSQARQTGWITGIILLTLYDTRDFTGWLLAAVLTYLALFFLSAFLSAILHARCPHAGNSSLKAQKQ